MGFRDALKVRKAIILHQRGKETEARALYQQLYESGHLSAPYMLYYSVILLREGGEENCRKVLEILKKAEKAPDLDAHRRRELKVDYAEAMYILGDLEGAIQLLEQAHGEGPSGLVYQILGYLYIQAGEKEKALAYNLEALEYDDEDAIVLDNLGQTYYRLLGEKETALPYFQKAHAIKKTQIDTLYFLSRYDLAAGDRDAALEKLRQAAQGRFSPLNYVTKAQVMAEIEALEKG